MNATLEAIRDDLAVRNFAAHVRFATNIVRTGHNQRSVMVTANGKVIFEKIIEGRERLPLLKEKNRLARLYGIDGFEDAT